MKQKTSTESKRLERIELNLVSRIAQGLVTRYPLDDYGDLARKAWKLTDAILAEKKHRDLDKRAKSRKIEA